MTSQHHNKEMFDAPNMRSLDIRALRVIFSVQYALIENDLQNEFTS